MDRCDAGGLLRLMGGALLISSGTNYCLLRIMVRFRGDWGSHATMATEVEHRVEAERSVFSAEGFDLSLLNAGAADHG